MSSTHTRKALLWALAGLSTVLLIGRLLLNSITRTVPPPRQLPTQVADGISHPGAGSESDRLEDVFNKTLGFQKIFAINLPGRTDRRDALSLAAAYSGLQIDYVDGIRLSQDEYAAMLSILPPGGTGPNWKQLKAPALGSWRAHLNTIRRVVEQDLASALIVEDDVDWDLRIHSQMHDFARAASMLVQPMLGTSDRFLDPSRPKPRPGQKPTDFALESGLTVPPTTSPYGDLERWDLLWLGHCGCVFPDEPQSGIPMARVILSNDASVPIRKYVDTEIGSKQIIEQYPDHTRVVHRSRHNMCSTGYAVSRRGARRLLYEFGVHRLDGAADVLLGRVCDGAKDRDMAACYTVQPPLFSHHRPVGLTSTLSDISNWDGGFNDKAFTKNIRWSTRLNFPQLANGSTEYMDSFPDGD